MLEKYLHLIDENEVDWNAHGLIKASSREYWTKIPSIFTEKIIRKGEMYLQYQWPSLLMTEFIAYERNGDRNPYQKSSFGRRNVLKALVLAECVEYKGRFIDDISNGILLICEETFWGVPAHRHGRCNGLPDITDHYVDIFAAQTGAELAFTIYLLKEKLDPTLVERVEFEIIERLLKPFLKHDDYWWQAIPRFDGDVRFTNNWNPWICVNLAHCLCLLQLEHNFSSQVLKKIFNVSDNYIRLLPEDGGIDEGPSYWVGSAAALMGLLNLLYNISNKKIDCVHNSLINKMGNYFSSMKISKDYVVNFADCPSNVQKIPGLLFLYGTHTGNNNLCLLAKEDLDIIKSMELLPDESLGCILLDLFYVNDIESFKADKNISQFNYLEKIQVLTCSSDTERTKGIFFAIKGGHNDESHNHNDVGSFILFADGEPVIIDAGSQVYNKDTFNENRYKQWNTTSQWHNLPIINDAGQLPGKANKSEKCEVYKKENIVMTMELKSAYSQSAEINSFIRRVEFCGRNQSVLLSDYFDFNGETNIVKEVFMSVKEPKVAENSVSYTLKNGNLVVLSWDKKIIAKTIVEKKDVSNDFMLKRSWGDCIYRTQIEFSCDKKQDLLINISKRFTDKG